MEQSVDRGTRRIVAIILLVIAGIGPAAAAELAVPSSEVGLASWYGAAGQRTASGESFDVDGLTAAHRSLPFHARVRITNLRNGRSVIVRINDRGPFRGNRVIDLSPRAAHLLGMLRSGVARVRIELAPEGLS